MYPHVKRPDGDNLEKYLNDSLNGVVWTDDSRIAWLLRSKTLTCAKEGATVLCVCEMKQAETDYGMILQCIEENLRI